MPARSLDETQGIGRKSDLKCRPILVAAQLNYKAQQGDLADLWKKNS